MVGNKRKKIGERGDFGLISLLSILILVILGLAVSLAMINMRGQGQEEVTYELPEELMGDDLSPEDQVIKETTLMWQDPNVSAEEIEEYYDVKVDEAIGKGDAFLAAKIVIQKMNFLVVFENDCKKANDYINSVDTSFYTDEEKEYLASYARSVVGACDSLEEQNLQEENSERKEGE